METMNRFIIKDFIASNGRGSYLVTFTNGLYGVIHKEYNTVEADIFLDTYLKFGAYTEKVTEKEKKEAQKILDRCQNDIDVIPGTEDYFNNADFKKRCDEIKREIGYTY